jgi:subtilase family protein
MRAGRGALAALMIVAVLVQAGPGVAAPKARRDRLTLVSKNGVKTPFPMSVVALIDSGINPYSKAFRDTSALAYRHPSTYIPGYPKEAIRLDLHLDTPYEEALKLDEDAWKGVLRGKLYWVPGTRIVGAISLGAGGANCPVVPMPPANTLQEGCSQHNILDDHGHGTMTASRAGGAPASLAPEARIVEIEGLGGQGVRWAADQGWIDVQSNSWINFVPQPLPSETTDAFAYASDKTLTLAASGNGTAYITGFAPTPTYLLSTAPPGVVLVGGHDNGKMTLWAGAPPHVVADAYAGMTAIRDSIETMRPDPIACCTSAASPYAAGGAAAMIAEARGILHDYSTGIHDGVVARGSDCTKWPEKGPLSDGKFTLDELKDVYFHTAEAHPAEGKDDGDIHWAGEPRSPDHPEFGPGANPFCFGCTTMPIEWKQIPEDGDLAYPLIGYGGINENSVKLAAKVLAGKEPLPERPEADMQYEFDQAVRGILAGDSDVAEIGGESSAMMCAVFGSSDVSGKPKP